MSLHLNYRPQTFAEVIGQTNIVTGLTYAIANQQVAPAYLFAGSRGTGKTSTARIFAKALNCSSRVGVEPCGKCDSCLNTDKSASLDVIELDAASNSGVDSARDLIDQTRYAVLGNKYRVFIIDECHMLSTAAFNALLKTLEEPPRNNVFILCTTDPHKVLATVVSRCLRFNFQRVDKQLMFAAIASVCQKEGIAIEDSAIKAICQLANGGMRDALTILERLKSLSVATIKPSHIGEVVGAIASDDEILKVIENLYQQDIRHFCQQLSLLTGSAKDASAVAADIHRVVVGLTTYALGIELEDTGLLLDAAPKLPLSFLGKLQAKLQETLPEISRARYPEIYLRSVLLQFFDCDREPIKTEVVSPPKEVPANWRDLLPAMVRSAIDKATVTISKQNELKIEAEKVFQPILKANVDTILAAARTKKPELVEVIIK